MPQRRVLVVEPDAAVGRLLALLLDDSHMSVDRVAGLHEGLDYLRCETPDLVILDVAEPQLSLGDIDLMLTACVAPTIVLTTSDDPPADLMNRGVDDVVHEPFEPDDLLARVGLLFVG